MGENQWVLVFSVKADLSFAVSEEDPQPTVDLRLFTPVVGCDVVESKGGRARPDETAETVMLDHMEGADKKENQQRHPEELSREGPRFMQKQRFRLALGSSTV